MFYRIYNQFYILLIGCQFSDGEGEKRAGRPQPLSLSCVSSTDIRFVHTADDSLGFVSPSITDFGI